jgi:hypothetical protein
LALLLPLLLYYSIACMNINNDKIASTQRQQ